MGTKPVRCDAKTVRIQCPIHGLMEFSRELVDVIDHPLMQRTADIRQTGFLNKVFPGATHTRFAHMLGTAHVLGQVLEELRTESRRAETKVANLSTAQVGQSVAFHDLPEATYQQLRRFGMMAALVHDLGHGPSSHTFDAFALPQTRVYQIVFADLAVSDRFQPLKPYLEALFPSFRNMKRVTHETMSCVLFAGLWHELHKGRMSEMPAVITAILLGCDPAESIPKEMQPSIPLLHDLVSSSPLDVDRLDYLARDHRSTGVALGVVDPRVTKGALVWCQATPTGDVYRLGWRDSILRGIEQAVNARAAMYEQVYRHKTYTALCLMLGEIARIAQEKQLHLMGTPVPSSWNELREAYVLLTDEVFRNILLGCEIHSPNGKRTWHIEDHQIHELMQRISDRDLWRRLGTTPQMTMEQAQVYVRALEALFPGEKFQAHKRGSRAVQGLEKAAPVLTIGKDGVYASLLQATWLDLSPVLQGLAQAQTPAELFWQTPSPRTTVTKALINVELRRLMAADDP